MSIHTRRGFIHLFLHNPYFLRNPTVSLTMISESLSQKPNFATVAAPPINPKKSGDVLSFFAQSGFSPAQLDRILKSWPRVLSVRLDKIVKPKIKIFQDFGFSSDEIADIITGNPSILHSDFDKKVVPSLSVLKTLLGSTAKVAEVSKAAGSYLKGDLNHNLLPNINLLASCGVSKDRIFWLVFKHSRLMLQKTENVERLIERAEQLGAVKSSKMFIKAVRVVCSMNDQAWELKKKAFLELGFSEQDIYQVFRLQPQVYSTSEEKIKRAKEVILGTGKYDIACIVNNPCSLSMSVEKRYVPRFAVLRILEGKRLIKGWPRFSTVTRMTDRAFFERYVEPYEDEVGEVYRANGGRS